MSFQIITHTPEQAAQWKQLAASNPSRVARTLALSPGQTTREGDTQGDVYPALEAVVEVARPVQGSRNELWEKMVDAGIAEVLCNNVIDMASFVKFLPNMPQDLLEQAKREVSRLTRVYT
jgi:hypothetical protein